MILNFSLSYHEFEITKYTTWCYSIVLPNFITLRNNYNRSIVHQVDYNLKILVELRSLQLTKLLLSSLKIPIIAS